MIRSGQVTQAAYVYGQTQPQWTPIVSVATFAGAFTAAPPPPPPPPPGPAPVIADQIDFELMSRDLKPGETLRLDTGCLVAFEPRVNYDIQWVGGFKTALFRGEGLFFATLTGPGRVWLQSLPFSRLAGRMLAAAVASGFGRGADEGSAIGGIGLGS